MNIGRTIKMVNDYTIKKQKTNSDTESGFYKDFIDMSAETQKHLAEVEIEKTGNWMLFNKLWLENEQSLLSIDSTYNYVRGDIIVSMDLGTSNIGTEIRYPHPCVVLYDNEEDWVVVAPITAASISKESKKPVAIPPFEVFVKKQTKPPKDRNEFFFRKDSVIQVDQITRISKHRAINKTRKKLRSDLLNQIDNIMLENYLPKKHELFDELKKNIIELKKNNETKESELELMRIQYADSLTLINDLQNKIKLLELQLALTSSEKNIG